MSAEYEKMTIPELEEELEQLLDKLDDTEILRDSVLGQTGNHVSGGYIKRFREELNEINAEIEAVKAIIALKTSHE